MSPVKIDRVISAKEYLHLVTGQWISMTSEDDDITIEQTLKDFGITNLWDYPLSEIDEVVTNCKSVVLVEIVKKNVETHIWRWYELPDNNELDEAAAE